MTAPALPPATDRSVEWIFFDVGSVLYHDERQVFMAYRMAADRLAAADDSLTFDWLMSERERRTAAGEQWVLHKILVDRLGSDAADAFYADMRREMLARYDENHRPNGPLAELLPELAADHRLGIIANQPAEARTSLDNRGLLGFFEVVAISEELELYKPDPELFAWAVREAGVPAERTLMVGDRIDNDIAPANSIGMTTCHFPRPSGTANRWQPDDPDARRYLESVDRVPAFSQSDSGDQPNPALATPDMTIAALEELPERLCEFAGS